MTKTFFRVSNTETNQGLWYNYNGDFTGLIHEKFTFCENSELLMDFDEELIGWLSAVETIEDLYKWFTESDVKNLQKYGWYIHEYEAIKYKFYERFQHMAICQKTSKLIRKHILE